MGQFTCLSVHTQELFADDGNQEYQAVAYYGLARAGLGPGDVHRARELGQDSLRLLEAIGNRLVPEVKAWLLTLQGDESISS